jgi:hypothetical protein
MFESYTLNPHFNALVRRVMTRSGQVQVFIFIGSSKWTLSWSVPRDACTVYGVCGAYGICDSTNLELCSCAEAFKPRHNHAWISQDTKFIQDWASSGCVPTSPLHPKISLSKIHTTSATFTDVADLVHVSSFSHTLIFTISKCLEMAHIVASSNNICLAIEGLLRR